jgi:hypothetical protein
MHSSFRRPAKFRYIHYEKHGSSTSSGISGLIQIQQGTQHTHAAAQAQEKQKLSHCTAERAYIGQEPWFVNVPKLSSLLQKQQLSP